MQQLLERYIQQGVSSIGWWDVLKASLIFVNNAIKMGGKKQMSSGLAKRFHEMHLIAALQKLSQELSKNVTAELESEGERKQLAGL